jgi:hypothetical protein
MEAIMVFAVTASPRPNRKQRHAAHRLGRTPSLPTGGPVLAVVVACLFDMHAALSSN